MLGGPERGINAWIDTGFIGYDRLECGLAEVTAPPRSREWMPRLDLVRGEGAGGRVPAAASLIYLGLRLLSVGLISLLLEVGRFRHLRYPGGLLHWMTVVDDANHFRAIALHGYFHGTVAVPHAEYAFFPGYPMAIRTVARLPWVSLGTAALIVTFGAGVLAAWGLACIGLRLTGSAKASLLIVALWAAAPGAMVLDMMYSEALFCALAIWSLYALLNQRWLAAGVLALLAGTVRNTAVALVAALGVAAAVEIVTAIRARRPWRALWRPAAAPLIGSLGVAGYWAYVAVKTHRLDGWFWVERHQCKTYFDAGASTLRAVRTVLTGSPKAGDVMVVAVILAAVVLAAWLLTEQLPIALKVYTAVVVFMALTGNVNYLDSTGRFLLPAVLLGFPLARLLAQVRPVVLYPLLTLLGAAAAWYGLFLLSTGSAP